MSPTTSTAVPFDENDRRAIRNALARMPYSGSVRPSSSEVRDVPSLIAWLAGLATQLQHAAAEHEATEQRAQAAARVIAAGRTLVAAFAPAPSRDDVDAAIGYAVHAEGQYGALITDIMGWIRNNRSWPLLIEATVRGRIAALVEDGTLTVSTGPNWTRWHLDSGPDEQPRRPAPTASTALFDRVVEAVAYHGDRGASVHEVTLWIANTYGGAPLSGPVVSSCLGLLTNVGDAHTVTGDPDEPTRWALGVVEQCPDCEGSGTNCLAHRDNVIGRAARSGR